MIDENRLIEDYNKFTFTSECQKRQIKDLLDYLIKLQTKSDNWIACSKELPKDETLLYWTTHEDGSVILHGYSKEHGFIYNWEVDDLEKRKRQGQVIAWMPIYEPQPYVERR